MTQSRTQHDAPSPSAGQGRPETVGALFIDRVTRSAAAEAFRFPSPDGAWESVSWTAVGERVTGLAAGLLALGIEPGERVAIMSGTRYEWIVADFAVMCAGAATTTVYPTTIAEDVAFILCDSDSRLVIAEDPAQLAKLRERRAELPNVRTVVLITGDAGAEDGWVISLDELARRGADLLAATPDAVAARSAATGPDSLATLIYTSGTTGRPKGVRLSHAAWAYQASALVDLDILGAGDLQYLWLPLAHAFGKVLLTAQLAIGFPTAVDGRVDRIVENLAVIRPSFMGAVPRIFEKAHGRIVTTVEAKGGPRARLFAWAVGVGRRVGDARLAGRPVPTLLGAAHRVADALVLAKIRARFGGRIRFFISGSAALDPELARWFHAAGILVLEGYGMTENAAGACINKPDAFRFGTVGQPFPGTEIRIAADGEILLRSPSVMVGYHHQPEATTEALDDEGWLHTGDIGEADADGFVKVTDRKKDLFKTSGGKYVSPAAVEGRFLALCPYAAQIVVYGADRKYCTALVALDPDALGGWAKRTGLSTDPHAELVARPEVRTLVQGYVDEVNAGLNQWETVKDFALLDREFTVEAGELTPSLKLRRKVVEDLHRDRLDQLYES